MLLPWVEDHFEEVDVDGPVGWDHAVAAVMHVVAEVVEDGGSGGGPVGGAEVLFAEELVDGAGGYGGQELAFGVGPRVGVAGLEEERTGGDEGDEEVGVHGGFVGEAAVLGVIAGELVGVAAGGGEVGDGFAGVAVAEGCSAFSGAAGDDGGEALVVGSGPHGGFAEAGDAVDGYSFGVDLLIGLEVVFSAAHSPGPGGDGAPGVGWAGVVGLAGGVAGADAVGEAFGVVGVEVAVVEGGYADAGVEEGLGWRCGRRLGPG